MRRSVDPKVDSWVNSLVVSVAAVATMAAMSACTTDSSPEPQAGGDGTPDPVLVQGRSVFEERCASCHGRTGEGGSGPRLASRVEQVYPDIADQIAVVTQGRGHMPAFGERLSSEEITAVVRYTRETL